MLLVLSVADTLLLQPNQQQQRHPAAAVETANNQSGSASRGADATGSSSSSSSTKRGADLAAIAAMQALWTGGLLELLSVTVLATIASGANIVPTGDLKAAEGTPFWKAHKQLSKILAAAEAMLRMLATFAAKGLMKAECSLSAVTITTQICSIGGGKSQLGALVRQSAISSEEVCQFYSLLSTLGRCATAERGWQEQKNSLLLCCC
jgi:sigma54-dependent transcription regulator